MDTANITRFLPSAQHENLSIFGKFEYLRKRNETHTKRGFTRRYPNIYEDSQQIVMGFFMATLTIFATGGCPHHCMIDHHQKKWRRKWLLNSNMKVTYSALSDYAGKEKNGARPHPSQNLSPSKSMNGGKPYPMKKKRCLLLWIFL